MIVLSAQPSEVLLGFCSEVQIELHIEQKLHMTCQPWTGNFLSVVVGILESCTRQMKCGLNIGKLFVVIS